MNDEIRRLRSEAHHLARGKAPRAIRYPAAFRAAATAVTRSQLSQGTAVSRVAAALGLPTQSLVRWLETPARAGPPSRGDRVGARGDGGAPRGAGAHHAPRCPGRGPRSRRARRRAPGARVIGSTRQVAVWAYGAPADLRKGFDGLSALVSQGLGGDPLSGDCYLFVNRDAQTRQGPALGRDRAVHLRQAARAGPLRVSLAGRRRAPRAADDERAAAVSRGQHARRPHRAVARAVFVVDMQKDLASRARG